MGVELGAADTEALRAELASIGGWDGTSPPAPAPAPRATRGTSEGVVLATWPLLLDAGRMQDGEPHLAGTAHRAVARMSPTTAGRHGVDPTGHVRVTGRVGDVVLPVAVTPMPDGVVWLPTNSRGCAVRAGLGTAAGDLVRLSPAPTGTPVLLEGALT
jgi:NADH-quinone oxidoreductase subunit G